MYKFHVVPGDSGNFLTLQNVYFTDKNDKERIWEFVSRSPTPKIVSKKTGPDAVIIIPVDTYNRVVYLKKEFRAPLMNYEIGAPAGLVENNEDPLETAKRELKEEFNLEIKDVIKESPVLYSSGGLTDESVKIYIVECEGEPNTENNEENEDIEIWEIDLKDVEGVLEDTEYPIDARVWYILLDLHFVVY